MFSLDAGRQPLWYDGMKKHTLRVAGKKSVCFTAQLLVSTFQRPSRSTYPVCWCYSGSLCIHLFHSKNSIYDNNFIMTAYYECRPALSFFPAGRLS